MLHNINLLSNSCALNLELRSLLILRRFRQTLTAIRQVATLNNHLQIMKIQRRIQNRPSHR
jgi:hypothetical protein